MLFGGFRFVAVVAAAVVLSGCSAGNLLSGKAAVPQATSVPVGNQLALPPDLSLAAPGRTTESYQPNGPVADTSADYGPDVDVGSNAGAEDSLYGSSASAPGAVSSASPKRTGGTLDDTLAYYNISKTRPDGKMKSSADLNRELRAAILAEKRRTNPNYGTIRNIGNIFNDG